MSDLKPEPAITKQLCDQIAAEKNPGKVEDLVESLRTSVELERDEARLRLRLIAQQYRDRIRSAPLRSRMFDVINFLGLIPSHSPEKEFSKPDEAGKKRGSIKPAKD